MCLSKHVSWIIAVLEVWGFQWNCYLNFYWYEGLARTAADKLNLPKEGGRVGSKNYTYILHNFYNIAGASAPLPLKVTPWTHQSTMSMKWEPAIGLELAWFTQLKRHKRFDDFVILVWGQGSMFHIAALSLPGGHKISLYSWQIQKSVQCCHKSYQQIPRYTDSEKV